ncbi:nucleotidyltransferase family protein [Bacillus sp. AK128]
MSNNKIIGIYLAAGKSSRMGQDKLSLSMGDSKVGILALKEAVSSTLDHTIIVTKETQPSLWMTDHLKQLPPHKNWTYIACKEAEYGQAHSLQSGIITAMKMGATGVMVLLADQLFLTKTTIDHLIHRFKENQDKDLTFVAARFREVPRPPILFSKSAFPELLTLKGDQGARTLIKEKKLHGIFIDYENETDFIDIDTKEEYEKWKGSVAT